MSCQASSSVSVRTETRDRGPWSLGTTGTAGRTGVTRWVRRWAGVFGVGVSTALPVSAYAVLAFLRFGHRWLGGVLVSASTLWPHPGQVNAFTVHLPPCSRAAH